VKEFVSIELNYLWWSKREVINTFSALKSNTVALFVVCVNIPSTDRLLVDILEFEVGVSIP
jgi:hypothetical protein